MTSFRPRFLGLRIFFVPPFGRSFSVDVSDAVITSRNNAVFINRAWDRRLTFYATSKFRHVKCNTAVTYILTAGYLRDPNYLGYLYVKPLCQASRIKICIYDTEPRRSTSNRWRLLKFSFKPQFELKKVHCGGQGNGSHYY